MRALSLCMSLWTHRPRVEPDIAAQGAHIAAHFPEELSPIRQDEQVGTVVELVSRDAFNRVGHVGLGGTIEPHQTWRPLAVVQTNINENKTESWHPPVSSQVRRNKYQWLTRIGEGVELRWRPGVVC